MGNKISSHGTSQLRNNEKLRETPLTTEIERTQRVLVIGNGSREHAIVWKLSQSPVVSHVYLVPANPALDTLIDHPPNVEHDEKPDSKPIIKNSPFTTFDASDILAVVDYCTTKDIDLVVVGPEAPLSHGIADCLASKNIKCFGPKQAAAELESSKAFSKTFMTENQIPTARYRIFRDGEYMEALQYVNECESNQHHVVVKASGLCGGKGVYVCSSHEDARTALRILFLEQPYGDQSLPVVIEERLVGREVSVMAFCDGSSYSLMPCAHDYKRRFSGDRGPNTGGMGCIAPLPQSYISEKDLEIIRLKVFDKTVDGLSRQNRMFVGVLYAGVMLTSDGPMVLEFNCRFGDPEAEVVLPLLVTDLYDVMKWCVNGYLADNEPNIVWREKSYAVGITVCTRSYPERKLSSPPARIHGLDACRQLVFLANAQPAPQKIPNEDVVVSKHQSLFTTGGRVACCVAVAPSPLRAFADCCADAWCIEIKRDGDTTKNEADFRTDIGHDVLFRFLEAGENNDAVENQTSYAAAGVNIEEGNAVVSNIAEICHQSRIAGVNSGTFGSFGALFNWNEYVAECTQPPESPESQQKKAGKPNRQSQQVRKKSGNNVDQQQKQHLAQPVFVSGCDGVGSKLLLAQRLGKLGQVGIDLVAMCVNDVLCHGAAPLYFLDYYACGKLNKTGMVQVVEGIGAGCQLAGCALVGGETAEMPGMYAGKKFDLAGFAVGVVDARAALPKLAAIQIGDVIVGLASSGLHSNGFSLVRKILAGTTTEDESQCGGGMGEADDNLTEQEKQAQIDAVYQRLIRPALFDAAATTVENIGDAAVENRTVEIGAGDAPMPMIPDTNNAAVSAVSLGDILLTPTRIYTRSILPLLRSSEHGAHVKALAHITGGGLIDNVPRVLPSNLSARIDALRWPIPPVFGWLAKQGSVKAFDMARTFNLGIGMVLVVDQQANLERILSFLSMCGETPYVIGHVADRGMAQSSVSTAESLVVAAESRVTLQNLDRALLHCIAQGSHGDAHHMVQFTKDLRARKQLSAQQRVTSSSASSESNGRRGILRKSSADVILQKPQPNGVHFAEVVAEDVAAADVAVVAEDAVETVVLERTDVTMVKTTTVVSANVDGVADDTVAVKIAEETVTTLQQTTVANNEQNASPVEDAPPPPTPESTVGDVMKSLASPPDELDMMTPFVNMPTDNGFYGRSDQQSPASDIANREGKPARIAVLISGTGSNLQSLLDYAQRLEYDKPAVWWRHDANSNSASRKTSATSSSSMSPTQKLSTDNNVANRFSNQNMQNLQKSFNDAVQLNEMDYAMVPPPPRWRPWQVVLVVSNKQSAGGLARAQQHSFAAIKTAVIEHSKYPTREKFDEAISCELRRENVDFVVLAGFMRILSTKFCEEWCGRLINVHPSLLPAFRGANAQEQAHKARVRVAGCTVHFVEPNVDAGPIILQACVPAYPGRDTVEDLRLRILEREHYVLPRALDLLVSGYVRYSSPGSDNDAIGSNDVNTTSQQQKNEKISQQNFANGRASKHRLSYRHSMANWGGTLTRKVSSTLPAALRKNSFGTDPKRDTQSGDTEKLVKKEKSTKKVGHSSDDAAPSTATASQCSGGICEWHPSVLRAGSSDLPR